MRAPANAIPVTLALRWSDQDANAHVNNATIVTLLEEARVRAAADTYAHVVRSLEVQYEAELTYTDSIEARVWISRIGTTSYQVAHELIQDGTSCVFATATLVLIDVSARRPIALPDDLIERLRAHFSE
ncbi:acyl-CoA thioesterase [Corynebacterium aurimucosum]|uniref:Acyl-CoA thioesterase n=1 Tax=Corynebacterium aurimucosum TaxID=169292 RepID=A0A558GLK9_9CORY|nr:acyl-CoA thioesterase [Corynebacterium aurimucosum]